MKQEAKKDYKIKIAIRASMVANFILFSLQLTGAVWSHSLSLISTTIDAFMDNLSNGILWATDHYRRKKNTTLYPAVSINGIRLMYFWSLYFQRENPEWNLLE